MGTFRVEIAYQTPDGGRDSVFVDIKAKNKLDLAYHVENIQKYGIWFYNLAEVVE